MFYLKIEKMKTKYILYTIFLLLLCFGACKKDSYLDRLPLSDISPQNFFKNDNDLQLYCNQYYTQLPIQSFANFDGNSDDKASASLNTYLAGSATVPNTSADWNFSFIRTCNFFLNNYTRANSSADTKNQYAGETLFFRANDYWKKVKLFGDVPYINRYITDTSTTTLFGSRLPHKQVMDSVLKDLNYAVDNIPASTPDGRLNKYMALALKARICLWEGTYRKYFGVGDETLFLQQAADAAEKIRTSGLYNIYTTGNPQRDYYNLFIQEELRGNPEAILPMRYITNILTNNFTRLLGQAGDGYSKNFVRSFLCTDGLPYSLSPLYRGDETPDNEVANRDPRYPQQIATRGFDFLNGDIITIPRIGTSVTSTGYQPIKGRSSSLVQWNANQSTLDLFIFRYAETLLIEAEAKAELNQATQAVLDLTVNKLRDRVGMPHMNLATLVKDPASDFPGLPVLLDEIRRERRIELGSEGFRFDDLHRWKAGTLINNPETIRGMKLTPAFRAQYPPAQISNITVDLNNYIVVYQGVTRVWNDKLYLAPLPSQELTLNTNLKQNPGW